MVNHIDCLDVSGTRFEKGIEFFDFVQISICAFGDDIFTLELCFITGGGGG